MILTCPSCSTRYFADDPSLAESTRLVRCAACGHTWRAKGARRAGATPPAGARGGAAVRGAVGALVAGLLDGRPPAPGTASRRALMIWGAGGLGTLALVALALGFRTEIVGTWPSLAPVYGAVGFTVPVEGLVFEDIAAAPRYGDGGATLTVTAVIRNTSGRAQATSPVRIGLLDDHGDELFAWTVALGVSEIGPRQAARFTATLARPPADAADLELRFVQVPAGEAAPVATEVVE